MREWIKEKMCKIVCHRACYGALAVVYVAGAVGIEKAVVSGAAAVVYGVLAWRG